MNRYPFSQLDDANVGPLYNANLVYAFEQKHNFSPITSRVAKLCKNVLLSENF